MWLNENFSRCRGANLTWICQIVLKYTQKCRSSDTFTKCGRNLKLTTHYNAVVDVSKLAGPTGLLRLRCNAAQISRAHTQANNDDRAQSGIATYLGQVASAVH